MKQPVKTNIQKQAAAIKQRIRRLPKLVNKSMDSAIKKDVVSMIHEFQEGIRRNNFDLERLKAATIKAKVKKGYDRPRSPLYGAGDSEKNSLINALAIRKIKNGWRIYRRTAKHHEADLPLNVLLSIHEHGALIANGFGKGIFIRIPPRPVVDKAIIRALEKKKKVETNRDIIRAINEVLKTGRENLFNKFRDFNEREAAFEEAD